MAINEYILDKLRIQGTSNNGILFDSDAGGSIGADAANRPQDINAKRRVRVKTSSDLVQLSELVQSGYNGGGYPGIVFTQGSTTWNFAQDGRRLAIVPATNGYEFIEIVEGTATEAQVFELAKGGSPRADLTWRQNNSGDIGKTNNTHSFVGGGRPRNIYVGTSVQNADGLLATPSYTFESDPDTGWFRLGAGEISMSLEAFQTIKYKRSNPVIDTNGVITLGNSVRFDADSTGNINSYSFDGLSGTGIRPIGGGHYLGFATNGTVRWGIASGGNIYPQTGNAYDIGDATFSVKSIYVGTSFLAPDGSAAAPSYSFHSSGNSDNGMYLSAANELSFATSGVQRIQIQSAGRVVIPDRLTVGSVAPGQSKNVIQVGNTNIVAYYGPAGDAATTISAMEIGDATNTWGFYADTTNSGSIKYRFNGNEKLRITADGYVGVNVTPVQKVHIYDSAAVETGLQISNLGSGFALGDGINVLIGTGGKFILRNSTNQVFEFQTGGANVRATIDSGSNVIATAFKGGGNNIAHSFESFPTFGMGHHSTLSEVAFYNNNIKVAGLTSTYYYLNGLNLQWQTDGVGNIGAATASRPDKAYVKSQIVLGDQSTAGKSNYSTELATVQTTDATTTTLFTKTLEASSDYLFEVAVVAVKDDETDRAFYKKVAGVYRLGAGAATIQGSVYDEFSEESNPGAWDCTIDVNGNTARVRVTGVAATTIEWRATVRIHQFRVV